MSEKRDVPQAVFDSPMAHRIAKEGHRQACDELARMDPWKLDIGNPNHPLNSGIFGYETGELLRKQYR